MKNREKVLRWSGYMLAVEMEFKEILNKLYSDRCPTVTESIEAHKQAIHNIMARMLDNQWT